MGIFFSDTFAGANGVALPGGTQWPNGLAPAGSSVQYQGNKARFTGGTAAGTYNGANRVSRIYGGYVPDNQVVLFSFTWPTITRVYPSVWLRSTNTLLDGEGGYRIIFNPDNDNFEMGYVTNYGGGPTDSLPTGGAGDTVAKVFVAGTKYWCRFGAVDNQIKMRVWDDGSVEPSAWTKEAFDTTFTTGDSGFGFSMGAGATAGGGETIDIGDFSVSTTWPSEAFPGGVQDIKTELELAGTWTDISHYVRRDPGITITRGRSDESSLPEPSRCRMALDNRDGRFSPRNPVGAYYGLGRNTPLRVSILSDKSWMPLDANTGETGDLYASTPDVATLDLTTDIDVRFEADLDSWFDQMAFVEKWTPAGNQRSWAFYISFNGEPAFATSVDGATTTVSVQATQPLPTLYGRQAVRVTFDANNGAGGNTVTFFYSDTISGTWTQLGEPVITAGATTIFSSSSLVYIGPRLLGPITTVIRGKIYGAEIRSSIGGTIVANPDFTAQTEGAISFADSTAKVWTLTGMLIKDRDYRFWGEVSSWPQKWDITGSDIYTEIEASGIIRRLGQGASPAPSSIYRSIIAESSLVAYWPCEDGSIATSLGSAFPTAKPMVIVGDPTLFDNSEWAASKALPTLHLASFTGVVPTHTATDSLLAKLYVSIPAAGIANGIILMTVTCSGTGRTWNLKYTTGGGLAVDGYDRDGVSILVSAATSFGVNGRPFYGILRLVDNGTSTDVNVTVVYIDVPGEFLSSGVDTVTTTQVGRATAVKINPELRCDDVVVGHVSVQTDTTTDTVTLSSALAAWAGESAGERIKRLCIENGIPFFQLASVEESELMGNQGVETVLNLLKECSDSDLGSLHEPRDNYGLTYRQRRTIYNQAARITVSYSDHELTEFQPTDDDLGTVNDVTVTRAEGGSSRAQDTTSALSISQPPDGVGVYDTSVTLSLYSDTQTPDQAAWRVHVGTVDEARYPVIGWNMTSPAFLADSDLTFDLLDVDCGDRIVVTGMPIWLPPDDVQQIAQGFTEYLANFERTIGINCTPASVWDIGRYALETDDTANQYKYSSDGSTTNEALDTTETGVDVTTPTGPLWTTDAAQVPFDIIIGGERMTVTTIGVAAGTVQTFTVTRSVNGVVKSHLTGAAVALFRPARYAL